MLNQGHIKTKKYRNMKNLKTNIHFGILSFGLLAFSLLQTSCTSLQQTTASIAKDDLYDTPTREVSNEVEVNTNTAQEENYQEYQNYQDDRFLRLKVANRNRWNTIDDFGYWNNPSYRMNLAMGYGMGIGGWGFGILVGDGIHGLVDGEVDLVVGDGIHGSVDGEVDLVVGD